MKNFPHKILKEDDGDNATVYLYGFIGQRSWWGDNEEDITDVAFLKVLKESEKAGKKRLDVRINSVGGSMLHMDGIISLMQSSSMEVHTWVDGLAASAAADIFLAAKKDRRHMAKNGKLMIHAPSTSAYGTAKVLRDAADMLDVFEAGAIAKMASDTGMTEEEVKAKYYDGADHWMSAKQAVEAGFVNQVEDYEAQDMPKDPEKMSLAQLQQYFSGPSKEAEIGWFKKLFTAAFPDKLHQEVAEPIKEEEVMNIENLKDSVTNGEIALDDVTKYLEEQGYTVEKAAPAPAPVETPAVDIAKIVSDAVNPLKAQIEALQKKLDTTPGESTPALPVAASDPAAQTDPEEDDPILKKAQEVFAKAAKMERREW